MMVIRRKSGKTNVRRYWPGKAPEWAENVDEDGDVRMSQAAAAEKAIAAQEYLGSVSKDDSRLRRLAESRVDNPEDVRAEHRRIRQPETVSTIEVETQRQEWLEVEEEETADDFDDRRRIIIRDKFSERKKEEAPLLPLEDEEEELEEEEEEDQELTGIGMPKKSVFVTRSKRDTIVERERLEAQERALEESLKKNLEERKRETKQIVVEEIQNGLQQQEYMHDDIDTDDEVNEAAEYEAWKAREISRLKRRESEDKKASLLKEKKEIEKVSQMSEEERREWERKKPKLASQDSQPKKKRRFMQKDYFMGAFFQSEADDRAATVGRYQISDCDFSTPTGEDLMDKTKLPKVMQVKHFGRRGRTKWTHLANEDTTNWNNA